MISNKKDDYLFIASYGPPWMSGMVIYGFGLAKHLAAQGHRVTWMCSRHDENLLQSEMIDGVEIVRIDPLFRMDRGLFIGHGLFKHLSRISRARVLVPLLPFPEAGLLFCLGLFKKKVYPIYVCRPNVPEGSFLLKFILGVLEFGQTLLMMKAKRIGALSLDYASSIPQLDRFSKKIMAAPPLIPYERFVRSNREKEGQASVKIGFVGRLTYEKGVGVLLKAFEILRKNHPTLELVFVGPMIKVPGDDTIDLVTEAIKKYPEGTIQIIGKVSDSELNEHYQSFSLLVLPSIDPLEALGMVQIEAMACGTPVVASGLPGVRLPVMATQMGYLAKPGDVQDLAEKILLCMQNRNDLIKSKEEVIDLLRPYFSGSAIDEFFKE